MTYTFNDPEAIRAYQQGIQVIITGTSRTVIFKVLKGPRKGQIISMEVRT